MRCPNCGGDGLRQTPAHDTYSCLVCGFLIHGELISSRATRGGSGSDSEAGSSNMLAADTSQKEQPHA